VSPADLGPGWSRTGAAPLPCPATFRRTALSSVGLTTGQGTLTETLATGADVAAAVAAWRTSLSGCGYDVQDDPLGDAGIRATSKDGQDALVVTGSEGVLVVVHAQGGLAGSPDDLDSWADLAFGTSCVAAPDGCH
jgi:hypothetical protein